MNTNRNLKRVFRSEILEHFAAIANLHTLAFGKPNEAQLVERIRQSDRYSPQLSLVAKLHDQIIGHILLNSVDLADQKEKVLSLAAIAVHPDYQNQGIGSHLIRWSLEEAKQ